MSKHINKIIVGVNYKPTLTPLSLYSIAARLDAQTVGNLVHQVRNKRMESFRVDMGGGIVVSYPADEGAALRVWIPQKTRAEKAGGPETGEAGDKTADHSAQNRKTTT